MTLQDFLDALQDHPAEAPLVFTTTEGPIGAGYHITEIKALDIKSIDCGGNKSNWSEVQIQLLDGASGTHLSAAKSAKILDHSLKAIPELANGELSFEFAPGNNGLRRYIPSPPIWSEGRVEMRLSEDGAQCKPASYAAQTTSCCGANARCC
jgi:hypothetical protein